MTSPASVGKDDRLRLFLALEPAAATLDVLERWRDEQLSGGRPVRREDLHVTLAFLGTRSPAELSAIVGVLRDGVDAAAGGRVGLEPVGWRETRSVGMLVLRDVNGVATALARRLHESLEALGVYRAERRAWLPHLTAIRFRQRPRLAPPLPETGTFVPSDAAAYLSRLHPSGARYEVLERVSLNAGG